MDYISAEIRLRPTRFAFLVRPGDTASLQKIFQTNTCLWGGQFNPIIPYFERVPKWWERNGIRFDNANQILNGYVDFFEPDLIVEAETGISECLHFDEDRVVPLSSILARSDDRQRRSYGLSVIDVYRHLYETRFQFVQRNTPHVALVSAISDGFGAFAACLFGGFPKQKFLKYFDAAFNDVFAPKKVRLNPKILLELYKNRAVSALHMGSAELEVDFVNHEDPALFVMDARQPNDLIDFWNYRAVHRDVVGIPVQWIEQLSDFCKELIVRNYRPLPGNDHGVMIRPKVMFSRSIPQSELEKLHASYLRVDQEGANVVQTWCPPIWRPSPNFVVRSCRPTVTFSEKKININVDLENPSIRFDTLHPEFASKFGGSRRWANVVRIDDWSYSDHLATVYPTDVRSPLVPKLVQGGDKVISTTEGLTIYPRFKDLPQSWKLVDGGDAFREWLGTKKISARMSESGRATQQIVQTLKGFWGVHAISNKGVIELLDQMARRPITHSMHRREFENRIKSAIGKDIWRNRVFETMVERKAVELGYELKCSKCGSWSWHRLSQLGEVITCDLCLRQFEFPMADPSNSDHARWAYRVIGPFALPDFAKGGYAAALAIRVFSERARGIGGNDMTWCAGHELTTESGKKAEFDFALWHQRKQMFGTDYPTEMVFGEAKSFGRDAFQVVDIERMKMLAETVPGAILVFATMKDAAEFSKDELRRLRALAVWGREYNRGRRQTRAPVIILTGTELFSSHDLDSAWKEKGGKHAQLVEHPSVDLDHLRTLADMTQQLYLDMPPYGTWLQKKWEARDKKRKRRLAAQN